MIIKLPIVSTPISDLAFYRSAQRLSSRPLLTFPRVLCALYVGACRNVWDPSLVSERTYLTAQPNPLLLYTGEQQECGRRGAQSINISGYAEEPGLRGYTDMMSVGLLFSCLISVVVYRARTTEGKARQGRFVA